MGAQGLDFHYNERMRFGAIFFDTFMLPLEKMGIREIRRKILPHVSGDVLEIGTGTGINLKNLNSDKIDSLVITDYLLGSIPERRLNHLHCPISFIQADVQKLPFPDCTFDAVISTLVFCSVPDPQEGLSEIYRVLNPNGRLYFIEHVLSHTPGLASIQNNLTPGWKKIAGGCHLNRNTESLIEPAGFKLIERYEKGKGILIGGVAQKKGTVA